jgi:hypothetical protein
MKIETDMGELEVPSSVEQRYRKSCKKENTDPEKYAIEVLRGARVSGRKRGDGIKTIKPQRDA